MTTFCIVFYESYLSTVLTLSVTDLSLWMRATGSLSLSANTPARLVPPSDYCGSPAVVEKVKNLIYENKHSLQGFLLVKKIFSKIFTFRR
jgi:hypothetical protein